MRIISVLTCVLVWILTAGGPRNLGPAVSAGRMSAHENSIETALAAVLHRATALREGGEYQQAADLFQDGRRQAKVHRDVYYELRFLLGVAACHFVRHQYQEALQDYFAAKLLLTSLNDTSSVIVLNGSL